MKTRERSAARPLAVLALAFCLVLTALSFHLHDGSGLEHADRCFICSVCGHFVAVSQHHELTILVSTEFSGYVAGDTEEGPVFLGTGLTIRSPPAL